MLECFLVHEDVARWVLVKILIRATLYAYIFEFETYLERTLKYTAVRYILQFCNHNGVTLAWLSVLKVNTSPNLSIKADTCSDFDFL